MHSANRVADAGLMPSITLSRFTAALMAGVALSSLIALEVDAKAQPLPQSRVTARTGGSVATSSPTPTLGPWPGGAAASGASTASAGGLGGTRTSLLTGARGATSNSGGVATGGGKGTGGGATGTLSTGGSGADTLSMGGSATSEHPSKLTAVVGHIPSFLSALGVMNTVLVFVYSTVLNRVATLSQRRAIPYLFGAIWAAMACLILAYILQFHFPQACRCLIYTGLTIWAIGFAVILWFTRSATLDSVHHGERLEEKIAFKDRSKEDDFGLEVMDRAIRLARDAKREIGYPMLIVCDFQSSGRRAALRFLKRGLSQMEGLVYFTFSRPHTTIAKQLREAAPSSNEDLIWIIDCYSSVYLHEEVKEQSWFGCLKRFCSTSRDLADNSPGGDNCTERQDPAAAGNAGRNLGPHILFADARNPSDVYRAYRQALAAASEANLTGLRAVYETLSDFVKVADVDLVLHYLRRVVVLEDRRNVRSLYLFWQDAVQGVADPRYLQWFFSTTVTMTKKSNPAPAVEFQIDHLLPQRVRLSTDANLEYRRELLFSIDLGRVASVARALVVVRFRPQPHGFLPELSKDPDYRRHLVNFLFYMVAIDHDTHRPDARYEEVVDGEVMHGSGLLYHQAEVSKRKNPLQFLTDEFVSIDVADVKAIFTTNASHKEPADIEGRTSIFRECATLLKHSSYNGNAAELVDASKNMLGGPDGLFEKLKQFPAYADEIAKKSHLFVKALRREGQFDPKDPQLIRASVDHVVMTIALRSGMVRCEDPEVLKSLQAGSQLDAHQEQVLREVTAEAISALARAACVPEDEVDTLLWSYGRKSLSLPAPVDASKVHTSIDDALRCGASARIAFINAIGGVGLPTQSVPTVRVPFTRFY
ncbi:MAG: hypothetical protein WDO69_14870 [Pseudomonadota bacterium]